MEILVGDKVTVVPTVTIGDGDVRDYVLAVECGVSFSEGGVTASITQDVYLNKPSGVFTGVYTPLSDFTKAQAEKLVGELISVDLHTRLMMKFFGEKRNAVKQDAPWIE
tara:strand:- start:1117 stop:1443 length:327 start_codon:yes stop_codon:yes gene_type:complete